jgi:hypothetical protein
LSVELPTGPAELELMPKHTYASLWAEAISRHPEPTMSTSNHLSPLLSKPYSERQRIVVVDDGALAEMRARVGSGQAPQIIGSDATKAFGWRDAANIALAVVGFAGGVGALTGIVQLKDEGKGRSRGLSFLAVSHQEASALRLPPGHPRERVIYVGHPVVPTTYFPAAGFHRLAFEDKFTEAIRILMALGATQLEVEHIRGWSEGFAADLSVPLPAAAGIEVAGHAGRQRRSGAALLFRASLSGSSEPKLPEKLVWYPHESTWRQVVDGRMHYGLQEFQLSVKYDDDYGIDAGFKVAVQNMGLELGGKFQEHEATTWKINGAFKARD